MFLVIYLILLQFWFQQVNKKRSWSKNYKNCQEWSRKFVWTIKHVDDCTRTSRSSAIASIRAPTVNAICIATGRSTAVSQAAKAGRAQKLLTTYWATKSRVRILM